MRRTTARALPAALVGAVLGLCAPAVSAEPAAEVSPRTVSPGGSVTVSVTCDPVGGAAPPTIDATSKAFAEGTVKLHRIQGGGDVKGGIQENDGLLPEKDGLQENDGLPEKDGLPENDSLHEEGDLRDPQEQGDLPDLEEKGGPGDGGTGGSGGPVYRGTARIAGSGNIKGGPGAAGADSARTVDGTCPAAPGGQGKPWSATFTVARGGGSHPSCSPEPHGTTACGGAGMPRGVRAGQGGAFTDSVPALVAGGLLIAGACGAAVHRLHRRGTGAHG
ncbi:hypothetical protein H8R17_29090 [Streptomyces sp. TRM68367]|nr:hypothetical protein [Streptomyces sp. TRM68367]